MKYRTTMKDVKSGYHRIISLGYCSAQHLLNYQNASAYTCGVYGWNADVYDFGSTAIVSGYRPFGKSVDYDIVKRYETEAEHIVYDRELEWEDKRDKVNSLLRDFLAEVAK